MCEVRHALFRVGLDGCSGLGILQGHVKAIVSLAWRRHAGYRHRSHLSCENSANKRQLILDNFKPLHLFGDVSKLTGTDDVYDFVSQTRVAVPAVDALIVGFSCKDASGMNVYAHQYDEKMQAQVGSTHTTLTGSLQHVEVYKSKLIALENVLLFGVKGGVQVVARLLEPRCSSILPSHGRFTWTPSLMDLMERLQALGYIAAPLVLDPRQAGMNQRRLRLWIIGVQSSDVSVYDSLQELAVAQVTQILSLEPLPMRPIESFLLPAGDDLTFWDRRDVTPV